MATRARTKWRPNSKGYFERQIGWKISKKSGGHFQHKFTLGKELQEAQWREHRIHELWQRYEATQNEDRPQWPDYLLAIAKRLAKGERHYIVPRNANELPITYAQRIARLELVYPVISYKPEDERAFEIGSEALRMLEAIDVDVDDALAKPIDVGKVRAYIAAQQLHEDFGLGMEKSPLDVVEGNNDSRWPTQSTPERPLGTPKPTNHDGDPGTLHLAMREYIGWIEKEFHDSSTDTISPWGNTQRRQMKTLIASHADGSLSTLGYPRVDEIIGYWRGRPVKRIGNGRYKPKTASSHISQLGRFFDWLHTSRFAWRKPQDYSEIKTGVRKDAVDVQQGLEQVVTFSLEELVLLHRYATPFEKLLLTLALNCGFGTAEIASLLVNEVQLFKSHEPRHQELLGFRTTDADSFIKRVRRKNCVYGEFLLFSHSVKVVQHALERRETLPGFCPDARLLVNDCGQAYDAPTKGGNRNQQIPNAFARLKKRIRRDGKEISNHSFGKLRKTAGDLIRRHSNGEVAAVFLCHGEAVNTDSLADVYTNRPFGKVFETIRKVEEYLAPVFSEADGNRRL